LDEKAAALKESKELIESQLSKQIQGQQAKLKELETLNIKLQSTIDKDQALQA